MNELDPVLTRLRALEPSRPSPELSSQIRAAATRAIVPRRVHPVLTCAVAGSVVSYLLWATYFASHLY